MKPQNTWAEEISRNLPHLKVIKLKPKPVKLSVWVKPVVRVVE